MNGRLYYAVFQMYDLPSIKILMKDYQECIFLICFGKIHKYVLSRINYK